MRSPTLYEVLSAVTLTLRSADSPVCAAAVAARTAASARAATMPTAQRFIQTISFPSADSRSVRGNCMSEMTVASCLKRLLYDDLDLAERVLRSPLRFPQLLGNLQPALSRGSPARVIVRFVARRISS